MNTEAGSVLEERLLKRVRAFAHVDDPVRRDGYRKLLASDAPPYGDLSEAEQRLARMLHFSLWPDGGGHASASDGMSALLSEAAVRREITSVVELSFDAARHVTTPLSGALAETSLCLHARYQREEILAALGFPRMPNSFRECVWYSPDQNTDVLFVTLEKSEADYSPTTMYRDYPISPTLFHWESQSTTSLASPTGRRYLSGVSTVLLFARHRQKDEFGTSPYLLLGPAHYVSHEGDRPIAITWRLETPMPVDFLTSTTAVAQ